MQRGIAGLVCLISMFALAGCAARPGVVTYSGRELSEEEVCLLFKPREVYIRSVDPLIYRESGGKIIIKSGRIVSKAGKEDVIELLPGFHRIMVGFYVDTYVTSQMRAKVEPWHEPLLEFTGVAGQVYTIQPNFEYNRHVPEKWNPVIVPMGAHEQTEKRIIGGWRKYKEKNVK
jgi:hypothetical protein